MIRPVDSRIVCDPEILCGKPTIRGTRISVELILERLGYGDTVEDVLAAYPTLAADDIYAALRYASEALRSDFIHPLAG